MSLHRWVLTIAAIIITIGLYNLPKVVVDNDAQDMSINDPTEENSILHTFNINTEDSLRIISLKKRIDQIDDIKKSAIFADSLASMYLRLNYLDSAVRYGDLIVSMLKSETGYRIAGEIYFKAFGFASDSRKAKEYADKAASCYTEILKKVPGDPDIRSRLAMTLVTSSNPMQGINMLREVIAEYPENTTALYNLGVLSMQSGQHEKAVDRFERLLSLDPGNLQAAFYLGVSYSESGDQEKAKEWFLKVKEMDNDPAIHEAVDNYLKDINEF